MAKLRPQNLICQPFSLMHALKQICFKMQMMTFGNLIPTLAPQEPLWFVISDFLSPLLEIIIFTICSVRTLSRTIQTINYI